ncbi:uncharacterized protein TNCV_209351 [Trichonephila clavipes]|uniref:Mutator-like transposase domain-containing protein n=1 Tax=Trichonephila clavipes TaxID=2585209 RepID=A0A8X6VRY9_TRICX|nr:uncharacterized protein TNCV_209351 [Trichonephila clavipes]
MNLPSPTEKFRIYTELLFNSTKFTFEKSMKNYVEEATRIEGSCDIAIALDGSIQKRGYQSLNGIVTATSVDTGKVINCEVFSKHCRCKTAVNFAHGPSCLANYSGSSEGKEVKGVTAIFERSEGHYGIRYTKYLGDGDSRSFSSILALNPYDTQKEKLDFVGHIQKRIGTGVLDFKSKNSRKKLRVGKSLRARNYSLTI